MRFLLAVFIGAGSAGLTAGNYHHQHEVVTVEPVVNIYQTYEVTETVNATEQQVLDAVLNSATTNAYTPNECQGVPEAQAAANNQMYMGTKAPQLSLGAGTCGEQWATSLMFGMRINDRIMLNGSWGHNTYTNKDSAGFGALVLFK